MTKATLIRLPDWVCSDIKKYADQRGLAFATAVRLIVVDHFSNNASQQNLKKTDTHKKNVGRPKKYSDKPCGTCGHYEDIHETNAYGKWTGRCLHTDCDCTGFIVAKPGSNLLRT